MSHARRHFGADAVVRGETLRARADVNITPLIDVLLVLLVIFMAALPLTQKALDTKLPQAAATEQPPSDNRVVLEYTADGQLAINKQDVTVQELEGRLRAIYGDRHDKTMFIVGAGRLRYKRIIEVIDAARGAGVEQVGIVTDGTWRAAGVNAGT